MAENGHTPVFNQLIITGFENRYLTFKNINVIAPSNSDYTNVVGIKDSSYVKLMDCNITGRWDPNGTYLTGSVVLLDSTRLDPSKYISNKIDELLKEGE